MALPALVSGTLISGPIGWIDSSVVFAQEEEDWSGVVKIDSKIKHFQYKDGLFPALKASRLLPIVALKRE